MKHTFFRLVLAGIIVPLIMTACSSSPRVGNENEAPTVVADLSEPKDLKFTQFFDEVEYVPLETNDTFLLGFTEKMIVEGNQLYFVSGKAVYTYDINTGKGVTVISKLGQGPGEYQSIFDICVDKINGNIEVLDNNRKRIMVYDSKGKYIQSIDIPFSSFSFLKQDKNTYWLYNNNLKSDLTNSKMVYFDTNTQKIKEEYFPIDDHIAKYFFISDRTVFQRTSEELLCYFAPLNAIYKYKEGEGFKVFRHIDLGSNQTPESFFENSFADIMEFSQEAGKHNYIYALGNFAVNGKDDILLSYRLGKNTYWTFAPHQTNETYTVTSLTDDFHFDGSMVLSYHNGSYVLTDRYLYFLITGEQFITLAEKEKEGMSHIKELILQENINEESNPILVKCKLKD